MIDRFIIQFLLYFIKRATVNLVKRFQNVPTEYLFVDILSNLETSGDSQKLE